MKKSTESVQASKSASSLNRRKFIGGLSTAALGVTIVPSHVLGGSHHIAPSDKINVAYIGVGTQGLRELSGVITQPDVQVTAVCDPQKKAIDYFDWSPKGLLNNLRELTGDPGWTTGGNNSIPGGRDNGQSVVNAYYAKQKGTKYNGCAAYADFRELFAKEKGIDAVKIMATDHMHGVIAAAAMKRGIHMTMHKPIANRLTEGHAVIELAKKTDVITHLIP